VGHSKAALLSVSVIQKSLPRRTLLQGCLVANDPHAAPAECNVRQLQSVLNQLLILMQTGFAYGHDCQSRWVMATLVLNDCVYPGPGLHYRAARQSYVHSRLAQPNDYTTCSHSRKELIRHAVKRWI